MLPLHISENVVDSSSCVRWITPDSRWADFSILSILKFKKLILSKSDLLYRFTYSVGFVKFEILSVDICAKDKITANKPSRAVQWRKEGEIKRIFAVRWSKTCSDVGAGDEARTRYLHLGKVALYRMSYARITFIYCSLHPQKCQEKSMYIRCQGM